MAETTFKEARRRYLRLFWPAMIVYVVVILGGSWWLTTFETEPVWLAATIAVASALPVSLVLFLMLRYFRETDEYTRQLQLTAYAYGATITISAIFIAGFLQMFDVIGNIEVFWFGPAFFFAYGLSYKFLGGKECLK